MYMIVTKFQRLYPYFWGPAIQWDQYGCRTVSVDVGNKRWRPFTGSRYGKTRNSACKSDSIEIPTFTPMFSRSSKSMMLMLELSDASGRCKSKMTTTNPEIFISQLLFDHSAIQLLDPEKMGVAVGLSLLPCI